MQYSTAIRNARLEQVEAQAGQSPKLRLFSGTKPANCAAADSGTLLAETALPADWMLAAADGSKAKLGTWSLIGNAAAGSGVAIGHFRIMNNAGTVCHAQGSVTATSGGGDMELSSTTIAAGQPLTVDSFSITEGNA